MESVWAIISTFRPDEDLLSAFDSISAQVAGVVVVDDASGPDFAPVLDALRERGAVVESLPRNSGIGAALNRGYEVALNNDATAVLSFDQDSHIPAGFVQTIVSARDAATRGGHRVGLVVPEHFADVRQAYAELGDGTLLARNIIQSGMLVDADVLVDVGVMREDFFIDLIDTEFELRVRAEGYLTIAAPGAALAHQLGRQYARLLFGRPLRLPGLPPVTTFSTPFRYFYRMRNRIILDRLYLRVAPAQIIRDTVIDVLHFANAVVVARPRGDFARVLRAGVNAGLKKRMGRIPAAVEERVSRVSWNAPLVAGGVLGAPAQSDR